MKSYILIDRSGSMKVRWTETVEAVNEYMKNLDEEVNGIDTCVTLMVFDGQSTDTVRDSVAVKNWSPVKTDEFSPRGSTPLYDALGHLDAVITKDKVDLADIIILTDGGENGSRELKSSDAKLIVDSWKAKDYGLSFIGADFDAISSSRDVGINSANTLNMTSGNFKKSMATRGLKSMAYYASGVASDTAFTLEDREEAVGKK